jgi:DNA polymerase (family 10)
MDNAEVAQLLEEIAELLELTGGNAFKARANRQAAQVVDTLPQPVERLWHEGGLTEVPTIGERIAAKIGEIVETGSCAEHRALAAKVPPGVLELLRLEGVGPKTVLSLWHGLGIASIDALEQACASGGLEGVPRLGKARIQAISGAIARHRARSGRLPLHRALAAAETLLAELRRVPGVVRAEAAGSVRRRKETVGDLDLLVASTDPDAVTRRFAQLREVAEVLAQGPTRSAVRLRTGLHVDLRVLPPDTFGAALHYFTGSKAHNIALRTKAVRLGVKLSEYGVFDREGRRRGGAREEDVFEALGLPWIPPELREGTGEIEAAEEGRLPRLVEEADLLGDLHVHTDVSSDGRASLDEIYAEAKRLGRRYLAVTDHSRARPLGLGEVELGEEAKAIRAFARTHRDRPRLLVGVEVDILPDGALDLGDDALRPLDWVVASVHAHLHDPEETHTRRLLRAIRSGVVDLLGHPTNRLLGARDASPVDWPRVLAAAREAQVALEVNAQPERLDLADRLCRLAKEHGVRVAINSDAHTAAQLGNLRYGVWMARRGWLEAKDVVNAQPWHRPARHGRDLR